MYIFVLNQEKRVVFNIRNRDAEIGLYYKGVGQIILDDL